MQLNEKKKEDDVEKTKSVNLDEDIQNVHIKLLLRHSPCLFQLVSILRSSLIHFFFKSIVFLKSSLSSKDKSIHIINVIHKVCQ